MCNGNCNQGRNCDCGPRPEISRRALVIGFVLSAAIWAVLWLAVAGVVAGVR